MFQISRDNPAYYLTSVAHHRLPIFQKDTVKQVICDAFNEARVSGGIMIFAYVIMPDHSHVITDNAREMKDVLPLPERHFGKAADRPSKRKWFRKLAGKVADTGSRQKS
ncbi:MAG: hypothetical protein ACKVQJ_03925 [Pyrinomonadaceae bacterium]